MEGEQGMDTGNVQVDPGPGGGNRARAIKWEGDRLGLLCSRGSSVWHSVMTYRGG